MNLSKRLKFGLEKAVYLSVPFIATAIITLLPYVDPNADLSFTVNYFTNAVLTAALLLAFYFPARSLFVDWLMNKDRIVSKQIEYSIRSTVAYNHLQAFSDFCDWEYDNRLQKYVVRNLQLVNISFEQFVDKYKFDKKLIKSDEELSDKQRRSLMKLVFTIKFLKKQDYEKVLPGTEAGTQFKRVHSSKDKKSALKGGAKVGKALFTGFMTVSIVFTVNFDVDVMAVALQILLRIGVGLVQIFTAYRHANVIVNGAYFSELSEKNMFIDEFIEHCNLKEELNRVTKSVMSRENPNALVIIDNIVEAPKPTEEKIEEMKEVLDGRTE